MNTPGRARPNDDAELDRFKDQIPIVALATGRYGYELTEKARNDSWHKLEKGGEVLIVSNKDGRDVYMNAHDTKDSGSVVDFVKTRDNLNLGQVRQQLRQYLGEGGPEQDRQALAQRPEPSRTRQPERGAEAGLPEDPKERRDELLKRTLGVQPALTDRSYLRERGISDETINAPAFQGRVFTGQNGPHKNTVFPLLNEGGFSSYEERNHNFKSQMPGPRDGIWVSHPTQGKGTAVERIVVGESQIDAMSKYQLEQPGGTGPNTMYMTSSGTVSQRQVELMQKVIDRQQPKEVVLANDNDPAGVRFNLNYLNDFRAPRPNVTLDAGAETPEQQRGNVTWRAMRGGDYHTDLKITFETERQREGRAAVAGLQEKVDGWRKEGGEQAASLEVVRMGSDQTVARVTVTNDQLPQLRGLVQELHAQREAAMPEAQRTPADFFKWEAARSKDYNQDLTDLQTEQRLQRAREQAGFDKAPAALQVGASPIERAVTLEIVEQQQRQKGGGAAGQIEQDLQKAGLSIVDKRQEINEATGERTTRLQGQYLVTDPEAQRRDINRQLEIVSRAPGVTLIEPEAHAQERRALASPQAAQPVELPERRLEDSKQQFSSAVRELGQRLDEQGHQAQAVRLADLGRTVLEREILPLRGPDRENLNGALAAADRLPALQENGQPGPVVQAVRQADKTMHEQYQAVQELGGAGTQRAAVVVLDDRATSENRAVPIWKDLKAEGAGVANIVQREVAPGMLESRFDIKYDPKPGQTAAGVEAVLRAAERSPGVVVEEPGQARQVRLASAAAFNLEEQAAGRTTNALRPTYPSASADWITYAVTSPAPAGSPELQAQTDAVRKAGGVVVPLAGQGQGEQTQLVSFHLQDPRLGAISEATRQMSEQGGSRYDVDRRISVGEVGGWAAGLVRLTEAQEAALRTPQILDDLRANGVLIQDQRRVDAPAGFVREEIRIAYQTEQNPVGVASVLDALKRSPGIEVEEGARQQQAREALAAVERERLAAQQAQEETRQAQLRQQQIEREQAQQAERERQANSPEAQRRREQEDRMLTGAILGAAAQEQAGQQPGGGEQPLPALDRLMREQALTEANGKAPAYEDVPRSMHVPDASHPVRYAKLEVGLQPENAQQLQDAVQQLKQAGATPGALQQGIVNVDSVMVGYRLDQPELPQIHRQLADIQKEGLVRVTEAPSVQAERVYELERRGQPEAAAQKAPTFDQATEQQRSPALEHPYRYAELNVPSSAQNEEKLRVMRKEFEQAGASVTAVEPHRDFGGREQLRIMVGYRIDQPELPQLQQQLRAAQQNDSVLYKERGGQAMERSSELERRQREPGVSLSFAPEATRTADPARDAATGGPQGVAAGSVAQPGRESYPAEGWKTQVLRDRRDDELAPVAAQLVKVGAQVGGTLPDGAGGRELTVSYHPAAVRQDKVLEVIETHQPARELAAPQLASAPAPSAERPAEAAPAVRTPERAVEATPAPQPAVATTTTSVSEQPFRTVGISVVEEGAYQRAQQLRQDLQQQGAYVSEMQKRGDAGPELSRQHFTASFPLGPQSAAIAQTLETAGRQPGINLEESLAQQRERQRVFGGEVPAVSGTTVAPATAYAAGPPQGPGNWQQGVVLVRDTDEERTRSATVREALQKAGAQVGAGGERNDGVPGSAIRYSYHTQQDHLEQLNKVLEKSAKSDGIEVKEQKPQQPGPELETRNGKFNQAVISIEDNPEKGKARAETIGGELSKGGAIVGEAKVVGNHVEMPVSYHTKTPNIQHINDTLDKAAGSSGIQVKENGEDRGARLQGAQQVARETAGTSMERERS